MESQLVFLYILPEHIWADYADNGADFQNEAMIGSGPFKLTEYAQNEFVHLTATDSHYLYHPTVDEVVFQTFGNQDALVQALRTGQVDMITEMPATAVVALRSAENVAVVTGPPLAPEVTDIILNVTEPENCPPGDGVCSGHPALLDRNVRQAMAYATDKQQIIDVVLLGLGTPGTDPDPEQPGHLVQRYAGGLSLRHRPGQPDPGRRRAMWTWTATACARCRTAPIRCNFRLNWPSDSTVAPRMAELLNASWSQIGIADRAAGPRSRHADLGVLPGLRLRRDHLGLGVRPRPGLPAERDDH